MQVLLDTDIFSEYLKGHDPHVVRQARIYAARYAVFTFTSITVHEILYGLELKNAFRQRSQVNSWMQQNEEVTPTAGDYRWAGSTRAKARHRGETVELADCLIAAVAVRLGRNLVTGNTKDFAAIQRAGVQLQLENWRNAVT